MPSDEPEKGDKVSWNWGSGAPGGTVAEKKTEGELAITSKRGNKIKKIGEPQNPAVHIERSGNDVVKKASELNVEEKANGASSGGGAETTNGEKRKHDEVDKEGDKKEKKEDKKEDNAPALEENAEGKTVKPQETDGNKKQKTESAKQNKEENKDDGAKSDKRKAGRPKKADGASGKSKKPPTPRATDGIGSRTRSRGKA